MPFITWENSYYMREFFNNFSVLIVYITALLCWLGCILMVRKNELINMESVEFNCHISSCLISVNYKKIYEFFLHITYSLQILCDMYHSSECKHVKCCVWNWGWSVCAEYTSACIHLVSLHYILFYKIYAILLLVYTHSHTHIQTRARAYVHACRCMSTAVINSKDLGYQWQKKEEKYRKLHVLEICLTSVLKQQDCTHWPLLACTC